MKNKNTFTNILHICAGKINGNKYMTMETLNIPTYEYLQHSFAARTVQVMYTDT
jgi:hypothetical protein